MTDVTETIPNKEDKQLTTKRNPLFVIRKVPKHSYAPSGLNSSFSSTILTNDDHPSDEEESLSLSLKTTSSDDPSTGGDFGEDRISVPVAPNTATVTTSSSITSQPVILVVDTKAAIKVNLNNGLVSFHDVSKKDKEKRKKRWCIYGCLCAFVLLVIAIGAGIGVSFLNKELSSSSSTSGTSLPPSSGNPLDQFFYFNVNVSSLSTYDADTLTDLRCSFYNSILRSIVNNVTQKDPTVLPSTVLNTTVNFLSSDIVYVQGITFTDGSKLPFTPSDIVNSGLCSLNLNYTGTSGTANSWDSLGIPSSSSVVNLSNNLPPYISHLFAYSVSTVNVSSITIGIHTGPSLWATTTNTSNVTVDSEYLRDIMAPIVSSLDSTDSVLTDIFPIQPVLPILIQTSPSASVTATSTPTQSATSTPTSVQNGIPQSVTSTPTSVQNGIPQSATSTPTSVQNGIPQSASNTPSTTPSSTETPTPTTSNSETPTSSVTPTGTPTSSVTPTPSTTMTLSATATGSTSATESSHPSASATLSPSASASGSGSSFPSFSAAPTDSATVSSSASVSSSSSAVPTVSSQPTATTSSSSTVSSTGSPSSTNTMTATRTSTPTPSITPSALPNVGCYLCGTNSVKSLDLNPATGAVYYTTLGLRRVHRLTSTNAKDSFVTIPNTYMVPEYIAAHPTDSNLIYLNDNTNGGVIIRYNILQNTFTNLVTVASSTNIRVDNSGNVYIAVTGTIRRWTASTSSISTIVSGLTNNAISMSLNPAGTIMYISEFNDGTNGLIKRYTTSPNQVTPILNSIKSLLSVTFDYTGNNIFYSDGNGNILRYAISNGATTTIVPATAGLSSTIFSIINDATGNILYFSDFGQNIIYKYTLSSSTLSIASGNGLKNPSYFAYVRSTGKFFINSNTELRYWDTLTLPTVHIPSSAGISTFTGMDVDPNNEDMLYVCDFSNDVLVAVNITSKRVLFRIGTETNPRACRFNPYDGRLYYSAGDKIHFYNPLTNSTSLFISNAATQANPRDFTFDRDSNVYVLHNAGGRLVRITRNGTITRTILSSDFTNPSQTYQITSDGRILYHTASTTIHTIFRYDLVTNTRSTFTVPATSATLNKLQLVDDRILYGFDATWLDMLVMPVS